MGIDGSFVPGVLAFTRAWQFRGPFHDYGPLDFSGGVYTGTDFATPNPFNSEIYTSYEEHLGTGSVAVPANLNMAGGPMFSGRMQLTFGMGQAETDLDADTLSAGGYVLRANGSGPVIGTDRFARGNTVVQTNVFVSDNFGSPTWTYKLDVSYIPFGWPNNAGGHPASDFFTYQWVHEQLATNMVVPVGAVGSATYATNLANCTAWLNARRGTTASYQIKVQTTADVYVGYPGGDRLWSGYWYKPYNFPLPFYTADLVIGGYTYLHFKYGAYGSVRYPPPGSVPVDGYMYDVGNTIVFTILDTFLNWGWNTASAPDEGWSNGWNLEDKHGHYHMIGVGKTSGNLKYKRYDCSIPDIHFGGGSAGIVHGSGTHNNPRMIIDHRDVIYAIWDNGTDTYEAKSTDDGSTWSSATMAFTGGKKPTIACSTHGDIFRAAIVSGVLVGTIQHSGDASASSVFNLVNSSGSNLTVENDTFNVEFATDAPGRMLLICTRLGESATSDWQCVDGEGKTWTRI